MAKVLHGIEEQLILSTNGCPEILQLFYLINIDENTTTYSVLS